MLARWSDWPGLVPAPFRNLSGEERYEYLAAGLVVDLVTELSQYPNLRVVLAPSEEYGACKQV